MGISVASAVVPLANTKSSRLHQGIRLHNGVLEQLSSNHVSFAEDEAEAEEGNLPRKISQEEATIQEHRNGTQQGSGESDESEDDFYDEDEEEIEWRFPEEQKDFGIDDKDAGTADSWVPRHPQMVRLTGRHPFNSEAPLSKLMQQGFITPTSLHYVRNHGPVPRAPWESWRIQVCGLVKNPISLSMEDLLKFPAREIPVTLVCAGNRRKEQNMVQQSIGFNWGPAGVSTSVWRGARLCDVLRHCAVLPRKKGARFVCFEGGDSLPKCGGGGYGTCVNIERAMDESQDLLVAYMQNGQMLKPDHGYPVRMIIPGMIGGRMVKWLTKIEVTSEESINYYHHQDNKVLPSHVDAEKASAEGWWRVPEYVINELNVNSVISTPAHGEILPITPATMQSPYAIKGYAYSGGGRKVTRVEVTLDGGQNWILCELEHPEKPTKYGKHWCWSFWKLEVEVVELLQARELAVRAWDESMNTQPMDLIWNLMGMMNNCWFRVKMLPCKGKLGGVALAFEHPTQPANQPGGWMVKQKEEMSHEQPSKPLVKSASSPFLNKMTPAIQMSEVRKHSNVESPWIVVNNSVYDCTSFLKDHPGGADSILINAGSDCTEEFEAIHSSKAKALLQDFMIGELLATNSLSSPESSLHGSSRALAALTLSPILEGLPSKPVALNPRQNISCKLVSSDCITHDLRRLRFALPSPDQVLGLPTGKHVFVSATINGKLCMRAYTPVSSDDDEDCLGFFELLIRVYYKGVHPSFPSGGLMSQHLGSLKPGDAVNVKGPLGHIHYQGKGRFTCNGEQKQVSEMAMLAGGTGITPVYQVIKAILRDPEDSTQVWLVYANRTEDDRMLKSELDEWARDHSNFKVWYVLSDPKRPEEWSYSTGYITEEIVRQHLPGGSDHAAAFMCGPPPMIEFACLPNLAKVGYSKDSCYQF